MPNATKTAAAKARPVKLQVNTSGAWKDVLFFDAGDDEKTGRVLQGIDTLGPAGTSAFRLVMHDALQSVLMHWSVGKGWEQR